MDGTPARVSDVTSLAEAQVLFAELRDMAPALRAAVLETVDRAWRDRAFGDFWAHMLVARGAAEVMIEPDLAIWDYAALQVIVEEAGGRIPRSSGGPPATAAASSPRTGRCTRRCSDGSRGRRTERPARPDGTARGHGSIVSPDPPARAMTTFAAATSCAPRPVRSQTVSLIRPSATGRLARDHGSELHRSLDLIRERAAALRAARTVPGSPPPARPRRGGSVGPTPACPRRRNRAPSRARRARATPAPPRSARGRAGRPTSAPATASGISDAASTAHPSPSTVRRSATQAAAWSGTRPQTRIFADVGAHLPQRLDLLACLDPGADHGDRPHVRRREPSRRHPARGTGPLVRDEPVVQQERGGRAVAGVEGEDEPVDRGGNLPVEAARDLHGVVGRAVEMPGLHVDPRPRPRERRGGSPPAAPPGPRNRR